MLKIERKGSLILPHEDFVSIENYSPESDYNFYLSAELTLGEKEQQISDIFIINICTIQGLSSNLKKNNKPIFLRSCLLVDTWNHQIIYERVDEFVRSIKAENYEDFFKQMTKYFTWEGDQ